GTGAGELVPELDEVIIVFGGYYLVGKHHLVKVDTVTQPGGVAARAEGHAAHCIAAARGVHRRGDAALEELGLGYCHQRPALAECVSVASAGVSAPPQAASESTMARHNARANAFLSSLSSFSPPSKIYIQTPLRAAVFRTVLCDTPSPYIF